MSTCLIDPFRTNHPPFGTNEMARKPADLYSQLDTLESKLRSILKASFYSALPCVLTLIAMAIRLRCALS